jgi:hypothetical protein
MKTITFEPDKLISFERLQEIKQRLFLTSPSPWLFVTSADKNGNVLAEVCSCRNGVITESPRIACFEGSSAPQDANFFCHAKEDMLALLEQLELFIVPTSGSGSSQVS